MHVAQIIWHKFALIKVLTQCLAAQGLISKACLVLMDILQCSSWPVVTGWRDEWASVYRFWCAFDPENSLTTGQTTCAQFGGLFGGLKQLPVRQAFTRCFEMSFSSKESQSSEMQPPGLMANNTVSHIVKRVSYHSRA